MLAIYSYSYASYIAIASIAIERHCYTSYICSVWHARLLTEQVSFILTLMITDYPTREGYEPVNIQGIRIINYTIS